MIRINLLPYRPERRNKQILQHLGWTFGSIALLGTLLMLVSMYGNGDLADLQTEFGQLQAQNMILKKKIGKIRNLDKLRADVERKLSLVDELQQGRFESFKTLIALSSVIPENVWLNSFVDNAGKLKIVGVGESNKSVANFMRALTQSPLFGGVALGVITRKLTSGVPVRTFNLTLDRLADVTQDSQQGGKK
ncbi:MAG: PilN domain-containing protein [Mariprofundaceae bacterium]|nr:PilN domain-containing protein [Mariprofundaceae bacterium]